MGNTRTFLAELEDGLKLKVRTVNVDTIKEVTAIFTNSFKHVSELVAQLVEWRRMAGLDSPIPEQDPGHDQVGGPGDPRVFSGGRYSRTRCLSTTWSMVKRVRSKETM